MISLDTRNRQVTFDYNPEQITPPELDVIAHKVRPVLEQRWQNCTLRLGRRGGRPCESCALALEREVGNLPGVRRATATYVGGVLNVTYDDSVITPEEIARRVEKLGVPVDESYAETAVSPTRPTPRFGPLFTADQLERLFTIITFFAIITALIAQRQELPTLATIAYVVAYIAGGAFGFKAGIESLLALTIDVDLLMILAAIGAAIVGEPFEGAILLFLFSLSNVLQTYALDRTRHAIKALMQLRPDSATVRRGNKTITVPIDQIQIGELIIVKPGERIGLDGVVVAGESSVDQSSITGESIPVAKQIGDKVFAGTINKNGSLEIRVSKRAQDSTLARLIRLVEEAQSEKAETQRFIDTAEQYYALGVIIFTALVGIVPLLWGDPFNTTFYRAMTVMVAASPCALVISTPATVLSAIGNGARRGVLFKGGVYVENMATIKAIAFDKTGTLTMGRPQVTDVIVTADPAIWQGTEDELLALAAAVESRSEHALAQATVAAAQARDIALSDSLAFQAVTGKGVKGMVNGRHIRVGNLRYFEDVHCVGQETAETIVTNLQNEGKTSVIVAQMSDDEQTATILGVIAFADIIRPEAAQVVHRLRQLGIEHVIMLTGDNQQVAARIAAETGVDAVYAELLPEDKVTAVRDMQKRFGPVAMIGDGVNDAPALAAATIGIAMGAAGTDVALETADIVLMSDDLTKLPYIIQLSRQTRKTLAINLGFAMFMILLMLTAIFTSNLSLPFAVVGHEGGTVLVSLNGLRLLAFRE
ncbi:MAG: cadmium-translocating P-type ATPase [Chloroflexi bacterium]|nr:MAG: cadmium-translocating P-type ATPase [Chloroflexota bacterium]